MSDLRRRGQEPGWEWRDRGEPGRDDFFADIQMLIDEVEEPKDKDLALGKFKGLTGL